MNHPLSEIRIKNRLSVTQAAAILDIPHSDIMLAESDERPLNTQQIYRLKPVFNVSITVYLNNLYQWRNNLKKTKHQTNLFEDSR